MELLSAVLTPMVLCFSLPLSGQHVLDFVRDHTRYVEGVGAVCDYSLFDFEEFGDDAYGAPEKGRAEEAQRPVDGKMEKSYMNFQQVYPNWRQQQSSHNLPEEGGGRGGNTSGGSPLMEVTSGEALLDKVRAYRAAKEHQRDLEISQALLESSSSSSSMSLAMTAMNTAFQTNVNARPSEVAIALNSSSIGRLINDHNESTDSGPGSDINEVNKVSRDERGSAIDRVYGDNDDDLTVNNLDDEDEVDVVDVMSSSSLHHIHDHTHNHHDCHNHHPANNNDHTKIASSSPGMDGVEGGEGGRVGAGGDSGDPPVTDGRNISPSAGMSGGGASIEANSSNNIVKESPSSSSSPPPPSHSSASAVPLSSNTINTNAQVSGLGTGSGLGPGKAQGQGLGSGTWGPQGFTPTSTQPPQQSPQQRQSHTFYSSSTMDGHTSPKPLSTTRKIFPVGQGGQLFNMGISTGSVSSFAPVETSYYRR